MSAIRYISTRGGCEPMGFTEAVLAGLAPDGGLLIPESLPEVPAGRLDAWARLPYPELAFEVIRPFCDLPDDSLRDILARSYRSFDHPEVVPLRRVGPLYVLELFHGPTLAFKDIALQWLGHLFSYALERTGRRLNLLAATSGDTGSAAIHGVRNRPNLSIFVMFPQGRISALQERQMTTVLDAQVHPLALQGTFDDGQRIMKALFRDTAFKERYALGSVNSVNWARVLAQVVYYFHAALKLRRSAGAQRVRFAVPTGNFGDILAGYYAFRMGLPVDRLLLATNENDILTRYFSTGVYAPGRVYQTLSPSMDIQVASNFERYLYYRLERNPVAVARLLNAFEQTGSLQVDGSPQPPGETIFHAESIGREQTLAVIRRYAREHNVLLDPHTAVGVGVAEHHLQPDVPVVCLATAHPAKFPEALRTALGKDGARHPRLERLFDLPTRCEVLPANESSVRAYLVNALDTP